MGRLGTMGQVNGWGQMGQGREVDWTLCLGMSLAEEWEGNVQLARLLEVRDEAIG